MLIDQTTLQDLGIFSPPDKSGSNTGVFGLLDKCITYKGRALLRQIILAPPQDFQSLQALQDSIKFFAQHQDGFTQKVSNGTVVMIDKFFEETEAGALPQGKLSLAINGFLLKIFNKQQFFLTHFSITHVADLVKGCSELLAIYTKANPPALLHSTLKAIEEQLSHKLIPELVALDKKAPYATMATLTYRTRRELKLHIQALLHHFATIDAWRSMALAGNEMGWHFPQLLPAKPSLFKVKEGIHPLLTKPTGYDVHLEQNKNFMILTGANMSGKTTYMRALGIIALLAHIGCAVPAKSCTISFLQGIITNMHVEDNLLLGESYFMAEVKRMKQTAERMLTPEPHLILMDELFKGTNVHDAYECTKAVIQGLSKQTHHLLLLSTHLYEVAQHFIQEPTLSFAYFTTSLHADGSFKFNYTLQEGISQDRIGYRILQQQGVIDLLNK